jgi:YVTN family beta-propeller protein
MALHLNLLGPVEVTLDGRPLPLGATKQRAVLALLALQTNTTVGVDRIVDGLWGDEPPATATKMVQLYVSQLRRVLAGSGAEIETHGRGYALCVDAEAVDATRFERLVACATDKRDGADPARRALGLWRGPALADVSAEPFAAAEIRRLEELRLRAAELAIDADMAAGREVLGTLERLVAEHPLRERLHGQRMLELYRTGRQAEALGAFMTARHALVEHAGVEPGAELRELHERILRQDPGLARAAAAHDSARGPAPPAAPPPPPRRHPRPGPRRPSRVRALVLAAVAVLLGTAVYAATHLTHDQLRDGLDAGAVGLIDARHATVTEHHRIGTSAGAVVAGAGAVWVAAPREGTVARIRPGTDRVSTIDVGGSPVGLAYGAGALWVAVSDTDAVVQVDPRTDRVVQPIRVGNGLRAIAVDARAVWAATALDGDVVRISLDSGRVTGRTAVGGQPAALAVADGAVWVATEESGRAIHLDATGTVVASIGVGHGPCAIAAGLGAVWVANRQDGTVSRIDPATDAVTATFAAGREPVALAVVEGELWVADAAGTILQLDPDDGSTTRVIKTRSSPAGLAAAGRSLWATAAPSAATHRGGTLRVGIHEQELKTDPVTGGYDPGAMPMLTVLYDGLVAYQRTGGAAGARLVGALARTPPPPAPDGRHYVFRLRRGLRYSDGTPVRADDVRASLERAVAVDAPAGVVTDLLSSIRGMPACGARPATCDLSRGVVGDNRHDTITINLRRRDPELVQKLAMPLMAIVPAATPRRALTRSAAPGTGPYRVARLTAGRRATLARNRYFRARPAEGRPDGFADRIEISVRRESAAIEDAAADRLDVALVFQTLNARHIAALRTRLGTRLRSGSFALLDFAFLNTHRPPFDDARVRRALNLAIDRAHVVDLIGGAVVASPSCQLLPPGLPGYRPACSFTASPSPAGIWRGADLTAARRLIAASGRRGTHVTVWSEPERLVTSTYLVSVLRRLGLPASLHRVASLAGPLTLPGSADRRTPQIGVAGWIADYPEPAAFLRGFVTCSAIPTRLHGGGNISHFCNHELDAAIDRAGTAGLDGSGTAAWQAIERRAARAAPVVPLDNRHSVLVSSRRAGNVQFHPLLHVLLEQIWVR